MSHSPPPYALAPEAPLVEPSATTLATTLRVSPHAALLVQFVGAGPLPLWGNPACRRLLGGSPLDPLVLRGLSWTRIGIQLGSDDDPLQDLLARGGGREDLALRRADGSSVHVRVDAFPIEEVAHLWAVHLNELTEVRRATEQLHASEARMHALAAHAPIGIFASEAGLRLAFANARAAELLGREPDDLLATDWMKAIDERDLSAVVDGLVSTLTGGEIDITLRVADHADRWLRLRAGPVALPGQGVGFIGSLEDVTNERAQQEALTQQARHDTLTGLPNRLAMRSEIDATLHGRRGGDGSLALLFLDLDHFKIVNDSLGHAVGDELLIKVASSLRERVRNGDMLARFGGDEFVLLCPGVNNTADARTIAERVVTALDEPIRLDGRWFHATASVGVVFSTGDATDAESLLRDADAAMYQAKAAGRGRFAIFDEEARKQADHRQRVLTDLRRAITGRSLTLTYQPIVDLATGTLLGAEALLRWPHPEHGTLPIADLMSLAQESGLTTEVDAFVVEAACADLARWRSEAGDEPAWISVNVSPTQLTDVGFPDAICATVARHGLLPSDLCIELTEDALVSRAGADNATLAELRRRGFRVAIDDFGLGCSSLAHLKDMPVDLVKIAQPFVAGLTADPRDVAISEAIIRIAGAIGMGVIAEGIESEEQRAILERLGCTGGQGYLLGRPEHPGRLVPFSARPPIRPTDVPALAPSTKAVR